MFYLMLTAIGLALICSGVAAIGTALHFLPDGYLSGDLVFLVDSPGGKIIGKAELPLAGGMFSFCLGFICLILGLIFTLDRVRIKAAKGKVESPEFAPY